MRTRFLVVFLLWAVFAPAGAAQDAPLSYLVPCADLVAEVPADTCARLQGWFLDDWRGALAGDRWAQISLAELFANTARAPVLVVRPDLVQACIWSLVVVYADAPETSPQDLRRAADICGRLPSASFPAARARALSLAAKNPPTPP